MSDSFRNFIDQVPEENMSGVALHSSADITVMRPSTYVMAEIFMDDYHFTIPSCTLPLIRINNKVYHLQKEKLIAFPIGCTALCIENIPARPYIAMNIKKEFFNEIARAATGRDAIPFSGVTYPYSPSLLSLISQLEEEIETFGKSCPLMLQSISTQIAVQILRCTGSPVGGKSRPLDKNYVDIAREYIMTYYNSNIRTEDICRQINISPYHFIRMFKDKTGITPHEFLQFVRIGKAEEILRTGSFSIEETARLCGFVSADHFSRSFKRARGMPPSEYRKKYFISK